MIIINVVIRGEAGPTHTYKHKHRHISKIYL